MGRRKKVSKRFLIGLDAIQAANLIRMSCALCLSYSEVVAYLMDYYQLGKNEVAGK